MVVAQDRAVAIIRQGFELLVKERQPMLHPRIGAPLADAGIERIVFRHRTEHFQIARAEARNRLGLQQHLANRPQLQRGDRRIADLGEGIERFQRLHLVAEQINAHRIVIARGEQINQRAAHGVFPRLHHLAHAGIAIGGEEGEQRLAVERVARGDGKARAGKHRTRRQFLADGVDGGEQEVGLRVRGSGFGSGSASFFP